MNSGRAARVQDALEPQKDWNRFTSGGVLVKNWRPNQATAASEIAIQTPPASSSSRSARRIAAMVSVLTWTTLASSGNLGIVAARAAVFFGNLVGRLLSFDYRNQLIDDRNEEDQHPEHEAQ